MKKFLIFNTTDNGPVYLDVLSVCFVVQSDDNTTFVTDKGVSYQLDHALDTTGSAVVRWYMDNAFTIINNPYTGVLFTATPPPLTFNTFSSS